MKSQKNNTYCCYILMTVDGCASYCGSTNNLSRRLRQHNQEIQGGARYTKRRRGLWKPLIVVHGFANRSQALSFEWHVKHCTVYPGSPLRRRMHQVSCTLRNTSWWVRYQPCPVQMDVHLYDPLQTTMMFHTDMVLPFQLNVTRKKNAPSMPQGQGDIQGRDSVPVVVDGQCQGAENDIPQPTSKVSFHTAAHVEGNTADARSPGKASQMMVHI